MNHESRKHNSREAFEEIFHECADTVYRLCLYKTSRPGVSNDLTQETFFRLWKVMSSGKEVTKPKQYVYQIARNLIVDYYKRHKMLSLDALREDGFTPTSNESTPDIIEDAKLLREAIETLDEEFRDVLYMRFVEEMKVKEIAEVLDISENLVSVRISRGKEKLRNLFS